MVNWRTQRRRDENPAKCSSLQLVSFFYSTAYSIHCWQQSQNRKQRSFKSGNRAFVIGWAISFERVMWSRSHKAKQEEQSLLCATRLTSPFGWIPRTSVLLSPPLTKHFPFSKKASWQLHKGLKLEQERGEGKKKTSLKNAPVQVKLKGRVQQGGHSSYPAT